MVKDFVKPGPKLTAEDLKKAEKALGKKLPSEIVDFLKKTNGGRPKPAAFKIKWSPKQKALAKSFATSEMARFHSLGFEGFTDLVEENTVTFEGRIPSSCISIAADRAGNQILIETEGPQKGQILFWSMEDEDEESVGNGGDQQPTYNNVGIVAKSFNEFLEALYE